MAWNGWRKLAIFVLIGLIVFELYMVYNPYFLVQNSTYEGVGIWPHIHDKRQLNALLFFDLTSKGFISTNYDVDVSVKVEVFNNTIANLMKNSKYTNITIVGSYASPLVEQSLLGYEQGNIVLLSPHNIINGLNIFEGANTMLFPIQGSQYYYEIYAYNNTKTIQTPIYTMNVTDISKAIPPTFYIEEGSAARAEFETSNRNMDIGIISIAVAALSIISIYNSKQIIKEQIVEEQVVERSNRIKKGTK